MTAAPLYWPAPLAWEEATTIRHLVALTRDPDASLAALRLWHHARRCGVVVPTADVLEAIAGGGRRRRGWAAHLVAAGLVEAKGDAFVIRPWADVAVVEWVRSGADEDAGETPEDAEERARRLDRERKARKRAEREAELSGSDPERDRNATGTRPELSGSDPERKPSETPVDPRARMCATETKTETETELQVLSSGKPNPRPPELALTSPPPVPKADPREATITAVLERWRERSGMKGATITGKPAAKRRARIRQRLDEGFTLERLLLVADGATRDGFLMGTDPKSKPGGYRDVETWFRDASQCERLIAIAEGTAPKPAQAPAAPRYPDPEANRPRPPLIAPAPMRRQRTPEEQAAIEADMAAHRPAFMRDHKPQPRTTAAPLLDLTAPAKVAP